MARSRSIDICGQTFGRLTVLQQVFKPGSERSHWLCQCQCGNQCTTRGDRLRQGRVQSCGCLKSEDLTDQTFGHWRVIEKSHADGGMFWRCKCECGTERNVVSWALRAGHTQSCGCRRAGITSKVKTTHGATRSGKHMVEYDVWWAMLARCNNPNNKGYKRYGGRGIRVCERWLKFENFLADMGPRPPHSTIERIDNDKDYAPDNCRWATWSEQARNKSNNRFVTYQGVRMTLVEAAEKSGVKYSVVHARTRLGWPEERWFIPQLFTTKRRPKAG